MKSTGILFALLAIGCDTGDDIDLIDGLGEHQPSQTKIIGGEAPNEAYHDAVVGLHETTRGGKSVYTLPFCSGTLIADDIVLTAAHCLDESKFYGSFDELEPKDVVVYVGNDPASDLSSSNLYVVSEVYIHPGYDNYQLLNDMGMLRLSSSVTAMADGTPVTPVAHYAADVQANDAINFAGFGVSDTTTQEYGVKLQVDGTVDALGCGVTGCPDSGDTATQFSYAQPDTGPCSGDSGGPAFFTDATSGTTYVAGLTSYGDANCEVYGVSTRVDAFTTEIDAFIAGGSSGGDDTGGTDPGTCNNDGVCDAGESCDGRDGTAECPDDCAGLSTGKPSGRFCYVEGTCVGDGCP